MAARAAAGSGGRSTRTRCGRSPTRPAATYYPAESADELKTVFQNLPTNLIMKHEVMEISVVFVAIGALLIALAILLGQAWRPLP